MVAMGDTLNINSRAIRRFALTQVATAAMLLATGPAWSLGLGRLNVQSALGETLKAEIEFSSLSPEEAASLKARVAPADAYRSSGVEYNSVLSGTQVEVVRRPDGRAMLRLSSDRSVQEPFVDVILELNWANGRLVREYTLLFDPPTSPRPAAPEVATSPVISPAQPETRAIAPQPAAPSPVPAPAPVAAAPATMAPAPAPHKGVDASTRAAAQAAVAASAQPAPPAPAPVAAAPAAKPEQAPARMAAHAAAPAAPAASAPSTYKVRPGDTLSHIAAKTQQPEISLDQMLVGLYRSNPDAFAGNNMNRLKSGAVLNVPGSDKLGEVSPAEAHQIILAQSADYNSFREHLSEAAPAVRQEESDRRSKGHVQAEVSEQKAAPAPAPDKLTLSKAPNKAAEASASVEAKISKETEKKDSAARVAELTRNVEELKKLSGAAKSAAPAPAPMPAPAPAPAVAVAAAVPQPVASKASAPVHAASVASAPVAVPAAPPANEPGLVDQLLDSPFVLPGAGLLALLLGGAGFLRWRKARPSSKPDNVFSESRAQPDSFFGNSGGQRVDTRDSASPQSSMSYSLSQLDAIGDVDPVAEADVYLAYGRDLQAEEILKEALRANPERIAIRIKLLEVYAKRRDTKGFEQLAIQLYAETHGSGDDWARVQELGRQIDPDNPLYQPGGAPMVAEEGDEEQHPEPMNATTLPATAAAVGHLATEIMPVRAPAEPLEGLDLDLDLGAAPEAPAPVASAAAAPAAAAAESMDFDFELPDLPAAAPAPAPVSASPAPESTDLSFDLDELGGHSEPASAVSTPAPASSMGPLELELGDLDLDLQAPKSEPAPVAKAEPEHAHSEFPSQGRSSILDDSQLSGELDLSSGASSADQLAHALDALSGDDGDPLQRQLELADEFRQIGDAEGARDVLTELINKAEGALKEKAQAMLDELR